MTGNQPLYRDRLGEVVVGINILLLQTHLNETVLNSTYKPSSLAISARITGVDLDLRLSSTEKHIKMFNNSSETQCY